LRDRLQHRTDAMIVHRPRGDEGDAPFAPVSQVVRPCRADRPLADLDDAFDRAEFRGPAHGAGQAEPLAADLLAPVDVRVDLQDGERAVALERAEYRYRDRVVAADNDRHRTAAGDRAHGLLDLLPV